jgi:hypothetical protein
MTEDTQEAGAPPPPPIKLPDTTRAQIVALAQAGLAVAIAFGVPISDTQSVALVALSAVLGTVLITADASIRRERARNIDKLRPGTQVSTVRHDVTATFDELVHSLDTVTRLLEAEHARHAGGNGETAKPRARRTAAKS